MAGLRARLAQKPPGYRFTIGRVLAIYGAIMVAILLAALDQTIVATALPAIVDDLGGLTSYSWVITSYILAMTVTVPLYGKLGDIYGRRLLWLVAISIFLSARRCAASRTMNQLVAVPRRPRDGRRRAVRARARDDRRDRPAAITGRYQGLFGSTFVLGSIVGPPLGGIFVDQASWRWAFYVNIPVGLIAMTVIAIAIPKRTARRDHYLDLPGAALLAAGTGSLLLGLVWSRDHGWGSTLVLGVFAGQSCCSPPLPSSSGGRPSRSCPSTCCGTRRSRPASCARVAAAMGVRRDDRLRPALRPGCDRDLRDRVRCRVDTVHGRRGPDEHAGAMGLTDRPLPPNALAGPVVLGAGLFLLSRMDTTTSDARPRRTWPSRVSASD